MELEPHSKVERNRDGEHGLDDRRDGWWRSSIRDSESGVDTVHNMPDKLECPRGVLDRVVWVPFRLALLSENLHRQGWLVSDLRSSLSERMESYATQWKTWKCTSYGPVPGG
jgi:hypothetical protein